MWLLIALLAFTPSERVVLPAHLADGYKVTPCTTYINYLKKYIPPKFENQVVLVKDTVRIREVLRDTILMFIKDTTRRDTVYIGTNVLSLVFTYKINDTIPMERISPIEVDSAIIVVSTDVLETGKAESKQLAISRGNYLKNIIKGDKVRVITELGYGRFAIARIYKKGEVKQE